MEIHQLRTLVTVAREGSVTRASELLHLSQPAVSAHIKAIEDALGLALFARTPRGMTLTSDGQRIVAKAEQTLGAHQELMAEATRVKGRIRGKLRLGASSNSDQTLAGHWLTKFSERFPEVEVALEHGNSVDVLAGIRNGSLDAGYYNEGDELDSALDAIEVARFGICLAAQPGLVPNSEVPNWRSLAELPWIYPTSSACCGHAAERLFKTHNIRPKRVISVDREHLTRTLVASGAGVGLLHLETANDALSHGEIEVLFRTDRSIRVLFAFLASRAQDPLLVSASLIAREIAVG